MLAKLTPGETKQFLRKAGAGIQHPELVRCRTRPWVVLAMC